MRTWSVVLGGLGAAVVLAACGADSGGSGGDDGPDGPGSVDQFAKASARTILAEAEQDMNSLSAFSVQGQMPAGRDRVRLDVWADFTGNCSGTVGQGDGEAEILVVDGRSYMRADVDFWRQYSGDPTGQLANLMRDRWMLMPPRQSWSEDVCDLQQFFRDSNGKPEPARVQGTEDIEGVETVRIATTTDQGSPLTVWVSTDDPHVVLRMGVPRGKDRGTLTFADFDEELDVEAPPDDEVIDVRKLNRVG